MKVYTLAKIKKAKFYYGTSRLYLQPAASHTVAIVKARSESMGGDSVNVYIEADGIPLQMLRAYKNGASEYVAEKIQKI